MEKSVFSQNADCRLTVKIHQISASAMQLHYRVDNIGEEDLYLCNQLRTALRENSVAHDKFYEVDPNLAHVVVVEGAVTVGQAIVDLSSHDGLKVLDIPCLTRLPAGQGYEQIISLRLPLVVTTKNGSSPSPHVAGWRALHFRLGYIVATEGVRQSIEEVATSTGTAYCIPTHMASKQVLITVGPLAEVAVASVALAPEAEVISKENWTPWS